MLTGAAQHLGSELAHGVQHRELQLAVAGLALDEAHVDDAGDHDHDVAVERARRLAHGRDRVHVGRSGEYRQPAEQGLLALRQHRVAPLQRGTHRALVRGLIERPADQGAEAVLQALEQERQRQHPRLRRGQLQRQRQPVESLADLRDEGRVLLCQRELRVDRVSALHEQRHRGAREDLRAGVRPRGHGQRRYP